MTLSCRSLKMKLFLPGTYSALNERNGSCTGYAWLVLMQILCVCSITLAQDLKPVIVEAVVEAEVKTGQRIVGTVMPLRTSTIGSAVDGRVLTFVVRRGDKVSQGDTLAQLRTSTLEIELAAAEAELRLYQQQLAELQNGSRPEDIAEAKANRAAAKAAMDNATSKLTRTTSLVTTRAASTADLDDANEKFESAKFAYEATEALLERIEAGPRVEAIAQAEAQVELQTQRRELLKDRIQKFTIRSPFDGYVSAEYTEIGAWISRGDPIAQVIQLDVVEIETPVSAESAVNLRPGDVVRVEFPELPDELLTGTVDRIVPVADDRSRTFPVPIKLNNIIRDGKPVLLAGMLARVDLPSGQRKKLPLVPKDALVLNGRDRSVFVVDPDPGGGETSVESGIVRKVPVDLGVAFGDGIQVMGDIKIGELVVVVGNERLEPKAKVKIVAKPIVKP